MKGSARPACGAIFRKSCRPRPAPASSLYSRAGYGASTPVKLPRAARLHAHRGARRAAETARCRSAFAAGCCSAIPTAPRSRRSMPAAHQDHRVEGVAMIAPHFIVEDISVTSIAKIKTAYETTEPEGKAGALAQGRRQRLLWLERRLARSRSSATGIFPNISPISACRSRSCRVWMTSMGRCARSRSRRKSAIVRSM